MKLSGPAAAWSLITPQAYSFAMTTPPPLQVPYKPFLLMPHRVVLSDDTLGEVSRFEIAASRFDCHIGNTPLNEPLSRVMTRMNSVLLANAQGKEADYRICCYLDYLGEDTSLNIQKISDLHMRAFHLSNTTPNVLSASLCSHYLSALEAKLIAEGIPTPLNPDFILSMQNALNNLLSPGVPAGLRTFEVEPCDESSGLSYKPPTPLDLPLFMNDLVTFINDSKLGPSIKAALVHFQLEATKMFSSNTEQLSNALLMGLWRNKELIEHVMPPIALTPALFKQTHDYKLQPYFFSYPHHAEQMLDSWVLHTALSSQRALSAEQRGYQLAEQMIEKWTRLLESADIAVTKSMQQFLTTIIGTPVFSPTSIANHMQVSYTTASSMISSLRKVGIIRQQTNGRRNRVFECPEATELFNQIVTDTSQQSIR